MKGRGTRKYDEEKLKSVTPSAKSGKTHYIIVDAVGVTRSLKTTSKTLIKKPYVALKDLAMGILMGARDEETVSTFVGKLSRLGQQLTDEEQTEVKEKSNGSSVQDICSNFVNAIDVDNVESSAREKYSLSSSDNITDKQFSDAQSDLVGNAAKSINVPLIDYLVETQRQKEQTIDHDNIDEVINSGSSMMVQEKAKALIKNFKEYLIENQDEIEALRIYFKEPHRRAHIAFEGIKILLNKIKIDRPSLMPLNVWAAYEKLEKVESKGHVTQLTALISLIRVACGLDNELVNFQDTARKNFQKWIMTYHSSSEATKFNKEQMEWLQMIRDHIATSFHIEEDDFDLAPFNAKGGLGKMHQLFGNNMTNIVKELNEALVA
mgnify:CR=1 FL=1